MDFEIIITIITAIVNLNIFKYFVISFCVFCLFLIVRNLVRGDF